MRKLVTRLMTAFGLVVSGWLIAVASAQPKEGESERKIKESEVPSAALAALKKLAGQASIFQYGEEIEHGQKYYEASWKGSDGTIEGLVTSAGDLVEIEEATKVDKVPQAVLAAAKSIAGKDAKLTFEKKTMFMYEAKFKKADKWHEVVITPDGRKHEHEEASGEEEGE